jgi:hypothetical protein
MEERRNNIDSKNEFAVLRSKHYVGRITFQICEIERTLMTL